MDQSQSRWVESSTTAVLWLAICRIWKSCKRYSMMVLLKGKVSPFLLLIKMVPPWLSREIWAGIKITTKIERNSNRAKLKITKSHVAMGRLSNISKYRRCNRGPEASGSRKRLVWQKNAILNMARPMKNSGTLPCMTFSEMAFKGHNQHSKSLNKQ